MTREELENAPYAAPVTQKIRVGRILMIVGCALLFIYAFSLLFEFVINIANAKQLQIDYTDPVNVVHEVVLPFLAAFIVFVGIGGIAYVREKGPLLRWASIGAIILGVAIVIDLVLDIRSLAHNLANPEISNSYAWLRFFLGFIGFQLFGGVYFVGWFLAKSYLD